MTYRVEFFKDGAWHVLYDSLTAEDADFYAGIVSRNNNYLQRTVRESDGHITHGTVSRR